ncbi:ATP-binding protein [Microbulbifer sp. YPW16]|uniref:ATP-binding protein n=1 Tax=Microbulbifer sp. YPW16 TaxID=2904242 RepID=UPI001E5317FE|nr:ATP-binding protein [Microbulbifer sp. YPW16]UHQ56556.1 histidine kinase [Microbulbifer sp. YPW16]
MLNRIRQSIVYRIGTLMLLTVLVALSSMVASYVISDAAENDAAAVNLAGSLRAMNYRLAATAPAGDREATRQVADQVAHRLRQVLDISDFVADDTSSAAARYTGVLNHWQQEIRPLVESVAAGQTPMNSLQLATRLEPFIGEVDALVSEYQQIAETKIRLLRVVQLASLFATVLLVYLSLYILHRSVEQPLQQLTDRSMGIAQGNFDLSPLDIDSEDELGVLARTINYMSDEIHATHRDLERRVQLKTAQLQKSHEALDFQYRLARRIGEGPLQGAELEQWLSEFSRLADLENLDLCLMTPEGEAPYEHLVRGFGNSHCDPGDCQVCVSTCGSTVEGDQRTYRFPLEVDKRNYGVLVCSLPQEKELDEEQQQRLATFADSVTAAIAINEREAQERRVALMDERAIIARELHDSLAQSLSYLKIQVTRLTRANRGEQVDREQVQEIIAELKQGLDSSYRQLRELLTTFRLQIGQGGLRGILEQTILSYREQHPQLSILLDYRLDEIPLTPHEEIHLLQLVREASQNAVYHSQGDRVEISLLQGDNHSLEVRIRDNGIGISDAPEKRNHFGMSIMQERASNLDGELTIRRRDTGGTEVSFTFVPDYARNREVIWQEA